MVIYTNAAGSSLLRKAMVNATDHARLEVMELNETETVQMMDIEGWEKQNEMDPEKHIHKTYQVRSLFVSC